MCVSECVGVIRFHCMPNSGHISFLLRSSHRPTFFHYRFLFSTISLSFALCSLIPSQAIYIFHFQTAPISPYVSEWPFIARTPSPTPSSVSLSSCLSVCLSIQISVHKFTCTTFILSWFFRTFVIHKTTLVWMQIQWIVLTSHWKFAILSFPSDIVT